MRAVKIFLAVGVEMNDSMAAMLEKNGFKVEGCENSIDAAVAALKKKPLNPDLFIINGLAQVSGATGGVINRNQSLLVKLKEIRMSAPQSRIMLLLPGENPPRLIFGIVSLGIYDIRQTSRFDEATLLDWIEKPMSIADYDGFDVGHIPDGRKGRIQYNPDPENEGDKQRPNLKKALESLQAGRGLVSKITGTFGHSDEDKQPVSQRAPSAVRRAGTGVPKVVLGLGDNRIEGWIRENFSEQVEVVASAIGQEELKQKVESLSPDILILMRQSSTGGIAGADELSIWAAGRVPAVLLIVGELDEQGREMFDRARDAGVRHIISCDRGGYVSGDELVYVLTGIIREMGDSGSLPPGEKTGGLFNGEPGKAVDSLLQGVGAIGRVFRHPAVTAEQKGKGVKAKKKGPRKTYSGGVALEGEEPFPAHITQIADFTAITPGGVIALVSPWKPNLAGRLAAQAVKMLSQVEESEVAYIGASGDSTGAVWLDVSDEELMMSDWRVPGSHFPLTKNNISIYAVDPFKNIMRESGEQLWKILKRARTTSTYTVLDLAGDMATARKAAHQGRSVLVVIIPGNDPVELKISTLWLKNLMEGKQNIVTGIDLRGVPPAIPEDIQPKLIIRNNPADALATALRKNGNGEFVWI